MHDAQVPPRKRKRLRILKLLEIGAGGRHIGDAAGEFTRRIGSESRLRRTLLRYASRRPIRGRGGPFRAVSIISSDCQPNPTNDLRLDAHELILTGSSIHIVICVGPRRYGFRNGVTTSRFLDEIGRVLTPGGELLVVGRFVNPWFNPAMGSAKGRNLVRSTARDAGLRTVNLLTPLGKHPIARVFRTRGRRFLQRACDGRILGEPTLFHRFVKVARRDTQRTHR